MAKRFRPDQVISSICKKGSAVDHRPHAGRPTKAEKAAQPKKPVVPPGHAPYASRQVLSDCVKIALAGDPDGVLDDSIPLHGLVKKIAAELSGKDEPVWRMHRLLELVWDRMEGRVPEKLEIDAQVRGVIALPVVSSSALDWSADAVKVLAGRSNAGAVREDVIDVPALPSKASPDEDE